MEPSGFDRFDDKSFEEGSMLSELDFIKFVTIFRRKIYLIFAIFTLSLVSAKIYLHFTKNIYESFSVIKLNERKDSGLLGLSLNNQKENDAELIGEIEIIKSPSTLYELIKRMDLQLQVNAQGDVNFTERFSNRPFNVVIEKMDQSYYGKKFYVSIIDSSRFKLSFNQSLLEFKEYEFGRWVVDEGLKIKLEYISVEKEPQDLFFFTYNSLQETYKTINNNLNVRIQSPEARTIYISYKDNSPQKTLSIIQNLDSIYFEVSLATKNKAQEQSLVFLNDQLEQTEAKLEDYENRLEYFAGKNKSYDMKIDFAKNLLGTDELEKKIKTFQKELDDLKKVEESFQKNDLTKDIETTLSIVALLNDPKIETLVESYFKLKKESELILNSEKQGTLANMIKQNEVKNQLLRITDYLSMKKVFLKENIAYFEEKSRELKREFIGLPSKETELTRLKRLYGIYEKFYLLILEKKAEFGITKAGTVPEFMVLYPPTVIYEPIFPKVSNIYLTSIGVAFAVSLIIIAFSYYTHNTIDNLGELERATRASILGVIPKYTKSKMDTSKLVVHLSTRSPVSEAIRSIRTNLEFMLPKNNKTKIISITSTISGEGKTFVSVNLSGVIAMSGARVVIIDLDMRKSKVHFAFDVENDVGMSNLLIGKASLDEVIKKTPIENYDFICAGPNPPNPSELLISDAFTDIINQLKDRYDVIFIDSPPVGLVTDGVIIMQKADLQLYVVRAEYSKKGFEKSINNLIVKNGFKNLGVILNCFDGSSNYGYGYRYGYGYGYGYYAEDNKKQGLLQKVKNLFKREDID